MDLEKEKLSFLVEYDYVFLFFIVDGNDTDGIMSVEEDENIIFYEVFMDYNYCFLLQFYFRDFVEQKVFVLDIVYELVKLFLVFEKKKKELLVKKERKRKQFLKEFTFINVNDFFNRFKGSRELINFFFFLKLIKKFFLRKMEEERFVFFDMYSKGIDDEDIRYMKKIYDYFLESDDLMGYWVNDILWVDYLCINILDLIFFKKRKKNENEFLKFYKIGIE